MIKLINISAVLGNKEKGIGFQLGPLTTTFEQGEVVGVVGPNGAGKSTLLKVLARQINVDIGKVLISNGMENNIIEHELTSDLSLYLDQDSRRDIVPSMTLYENLLLTLIRSKAGNFSYAKKKSTQILIRDTLENTPLNLVARVKQQAGLLSGGERQVLVLTRSLILNPKVLLLDEFISAMASNLSRSVLEIVRNAVVKNNSYCIIVTHDMEIAIDYCDKIIFIHSGKILDEFDPKKENIRSDLANLFSEVAKGMQA